MGTDEYREMLEELLELEEGLSEWEVSFIESLSQIPRFATFTEKQEEKLLELWTKHCC